MGFFDLFKKKYKSGTKDMRSSNPEVFSNEAEVLPNQTCSNKVEERKKEQTIYFNNGTLYKIEGEPKDNWYNARYLVSDGLVFDLESAESVRSIPIPIFDENNDCASSYGITGSLEYVLRMKAGNAYNQKKRELCSALLWKSTEMMFSFEFRWQKKDYDRIVHWHYQLAMPEEAEKAQAWLNTYPQYTENLFDRCAKSIRDSVMSHSIERNEDLVVYHDTSVVSDCCGECAKLRGRVYSISGKSNIYPALPKYAKLHGNFHPGCRCTMSSYLGDDIFYKGERVDPIKASIRPWVDDRTDAEKNNYEERIQRSDQEVVVDKEKLEDKKKYYEIIEKLPNDAPKSFGAYRRMKNGNTSGFKKLQAKALEIGIDI